MDSIFKIAGFFFLESGMNPVFPEGWIHTKSITKNLLIIKILRGLKIPIFCYV